MNRLSITGCLCFVIQFATAQSEFGFVAGMHAADQRVPFPAESSVLIIFISGVPETGDSAGKRDCYMMIIKYLWMVHFSDQ